MAERGEPLWMQHGHGQPHRRRPHRRPRRHVRRGGRARGGTPRPAALAGRRAVAQRLRRADRRRRHGSAVRPPAAAPSTRSSPPRRARRASRSPRASRTASLCFAGRDRPRRPAQRERSAAAWSRPATAAPRSRSCPGLTFTVLAPAAKRLTKLQQAWERWESEHPRRRRADGRQPRPLGLQPLEHRRARQVRRARRCC